MKVAEASFVSLPPSKELAAEGEIIYLQSYFYHMLKIW